VDELVHRIRASGQPRDRAIAALATRQHGVVARRQLTALGLGRGTIAHGLAAGRLHRLHEGVFAVGHPRITAHGRWLAAVLACGDGALLSHRTAAGLWGLSQVASANAHVTVTARGRRSRAGILLHQARRLDPADRALREGIPVTSIPRTLLDLAEVVNETQLRRAFEAADRLRLLNVAAVQDVCERSRGRHGLGRLRALLARHTYATEDTNPGIEEAFLDLCRLSGLLLPSVNVLVEGFEVDAVWFDQKLIVELDSFAFHRTRAAFERDRARDTKLLAAGYRVLRITARQLADDPAGVVETICRLLAA
jgi:very-short-patch-repair endonuclease/predicted transcriptional regulator of viral defense system